MTRVIFALSVVLVVAVRYEGLFLVIAVALLFFLERRKGEAFEFLGLGVLPIVLYGAVSMTNGWLFLPNSIFLKGAKPILDSTLGVIYSLLGYRALRNLFEAPDMLSLFTMNLAAVLILFRRHREDRIARSFPNLVFLVSAVLHLQFAHIGYLYRYEAYLIVLGLVALASLVPEFFDFVRRIGPGPSGGRVVPYTVAAVLLIVALKPLFERSERSYIDAPEASHDRYLEHIQPALFLRENYNGQTVVLNDIGAAAFYTDCRILDMYGLASMEPIRFREEPSGYTPADVYEWARRRGARIAILQVQWPEIGDRIPREWPQVCEWHLPRNVAFGDTMVGFFGTDQIEALRLDLLMKRFIPELPKGISVEFSTGIVPPPRLRGYSRERESTRRVRPHPFLQTGDEASTGEEMTDQPEFLLPTDRGGVNDETRMQMQNDQESEDDERGMELLGDREEDADQPVMEVPGDQDADDE